MSTMIIWISYDKVSPAMALKYAKDYFNSCGVTSYYLEPLIFKDMTKAEQDKHRILILELKNTIRDFPSIKWIIQYWKGSGWGRI